MALRAVAIPTSIQNCRVWLDATDTNSIITSAGNLIQWNDKSNNANNAIKFGSGNITVGSNPARIILSGSEYLQNSFIDNINTLFFVYTALENSPIYSTSDRTNGVTGFFPVGSSLTLIDRGTLGWHTASNIFTINSLTLAVVQYSTNLNVWRNGTRVISDVTFNNITRDWFRLGFRTPFNNFMTGSYNEIICYNRALEDSERITIESYLTTKWGLASSLPAGHPGFGALPFGTPGHRSSINPLPYSSFFNPAAIAGCRFWFDATDTSATGMTLSGTTVTQWRDKSGNGLHTSASNGTMTLVNNSDTRRTTINFPANSSFTMPNVSYTSSIRSIFCVITIGNLQGGGVQYLVLNGNTMLRSVQLYSINSGFQFNGSFLEVFATANNPAGFFNNTSIVYCGTTSGNSGVTVNGAAISLSVNNSSSSFQTGSAAQTIGGVNPIQISEMIVYDGSLSADDRINIESYLANKYNLDSRLIAGHRNFTLPAGAPRDIISIRRGFVPGIILNFSISNAILGTDYTIITNNARLFYNFLATGKTMAVVTTSTLIIDYFAIGGGGGGGAFYAAGGGGAGGLQQGQITLLPGTYTITIGAGGAGGPGIGGGSNTTGFGALGNNTTFGSITAFGGGGGGYHSGRLNGANGGCGGGGAPFVGTGGIGSQGGNGGGPVQSPPAAGGGGGISGNGIPGGNGGNGVLYLGVAYGGGGGAGSDGTRGLGVFGGGNGAGANGGSGSNATPNTGGGGGGAGGLDASTGASGGAGGSGIFIFALSISIQIIFNFTGAVQSFVIPAGITSIRVFMWGAGGGGSTNTNNIGGAGAYVEGILAVTSGETLRVIVGAAGFPDGAAGSLDIGGGGSQGGNRGSGSGGGRSALQRTTNLDIVAVGGGGGAAYGPGGAGSWIGTAEDGKDISTAIGPRGKGASQTAGGAGGTGNFSSGTSGSLGQGGNGGDYAAGGGGGYFGGGGSGADGGNAAGAGGGSSFTANLTNANGFNSPNSNSSPNQTSSFFSGIIGRGGLNTSGNYSGGNGRVVIQHN